MVTPAFRRVVTPLSVWIAMLALVLQSLMPMAAQARLRVMAPATAAAAAVAAMPDAAQHATTAPHDAPAHAMAGHAGVATAEAHCAGEHHAHDSAPAALHTALDPPAPATPNPHAMHGDAPCPYCRIHLDAVVVATVPVREHVLLRTVAPRPIVDAERPQPRDPWSPTRPRGPPALS